MFVDVKAFEVSTAIGVVTIGVWTVTTFRLRVIWGSGSVAEVDDGMGDRLAALVDPVSVFPRSCSPIFGKSLRVGVQKSGNASLKRG